MPDNQGTHLTQGEGLEPHSSNPASVQDTVEEAMKAAQEKADAPAPDEGEPPVQQEPAGGDTTPESAPSDETAKPDTEIQVGDLEPPPEWSATDQDTFRNCPKEVQEWLLARDQATVGRFQEQLSGLEPYQRLQTEWGPYITKVGQPTAQFLGGLLQADMILRTGTPEQKRAFIGNLMSTYGIDAGQPPQPSLPQEVVDDPVAQAVMAPLQEVQQQIQALKSHMDTQLGNFQATQNQSAQATLDAFRGAKDEKGNLAHPHYDEVKPLMESLAANARASGQQLTLEEVYQSACWATPSVRAKLQSAQSSADLLARQQAAAQKQRAASSVSSSPAGTRTSTDGYNPKESALETVQRAMAQASGSGA